MNVASGAMSINQADPADYSSPVRHKRPRSNEVVGLDDGPDVVVTVASSHEPSFAQHSEHGSSGNSSPASEGLRIVDHFHAFQRQKRARIALHAAAEEENVIERKDVNEAKEDLDSAQGSTDVGISVPAGFRSTHHCCRLCRTLLPAACFYPSSLKRCAFYCKACSVVKNRANTATRVHKQKAQQNQRQQQVLSSDSVADHAMGSEDMVRAVSTSISTPQDTAMKMLNRLRRMCARPSACGLRLVLSTPVALNFDVKVARQLLLWWNSCSALGQDPASTNRTATCNDGLRFIPWNKNDSLPLQPWEVIPVTRLQARRLTSTPPFLWKDLLEPSALAHAANRNAELRQMLTGEQMV